MLALTLAVVLQVAGLMAPLVHAHPDDHATAHHAGRVVHTHWSGHAPAAHDEDAVEAPDADRALFLDAFLAVDVPAFASPLVTPATPRLGAPAERAAARTFDVAHGLDPPFPSALPARAPPRLPVLI